MWKQLLWLKMTLKILDKIKENHWLMMLICCLVPLIIAGALVYFGFKTYAIFAAMLLCPVLHYFMMKDMHRSSEFKNTQKCHTNSISGMKDMHKKHKEKTERGKHH